jgi:hypothetical protein
VTEAGARPADTGRGRATRREQCAAVTNKASGRLTVAAGAPLLAAEQTWNLSDRYRWPARLFWVPLVVMLGAAVLTAAVRMSRDARPPEAGAVQPPLAR